MTKSTLVTLALGSCTLGVFLPACNNGDDTPTQVEKPHIKVFQIRKQTVTDTGDWFGYLRGKNDTDIHPRVSGFLVAQEYKDGQYVKKGDILFRIDPELFEAELAQATANLRAAEAALAAAQATREQLKLDVSRYEQLVKTSAISEKQLSDAQHHLRAAEANVKACEASIEQNKASVAKAQINLDYTIVRAPYDGVVGTALASLGDLVGESTKLTNITAINPIRVDFSLNSDALVNSFRKFGKVESAKRNANLTSPNFDLILEDESIHPYKGTLLSMESKIDTTGLIDVEGEIENPEQKLRSGMPVRVRIPLGTKEALLVPQEAIRTVLRNNFIIVIDKKNQPHTVPVLLDGKYEVTITEEDGFTSTQQLVAIKDYSRALTDYFREFGYEDATQVPIVADKENGVHAMNISSANSRLAKDDATPRATVQTTPFSFRPTLTPAEKAALAQAKNGAQKTVDKPATLPPFPVQVMPLVQQDVAMQHEWFGTLRGQEETDIRTKVSGFLLTQNFRNGTIVKKGDVLYTIDPAPFKAALAEAQGNLLSAQASFEQVKAQLDMSRADYERYRKLTETSPGAISDKTLTDAATQLKTTEAAWRKAQAIVEQMKAAVNLAEINLSYTTITAPFDGRAGISKPSIGALVSPTDTKPLVTLSSTNPMRVDFSVSGKGALTGIDALHAGKVSEENRPAFELILKDGSVYPTKGVIVSANNALSTSTGTFGMVGMIENTDSGLRSGMPVRVRAGMQKVNGAFLVPARAPLSAEGRDLILLLGKDNAPDALPITKGAMVNVPVDEGEGKVTTQPMYIIDVDRDSMTPLLLAKTGASSLDAFILAQTKSQNWDELALKQFEVVDFKTYAEKLEGKTLPEEHPQTEGAADWKSLVLQYKGVKNSKELLFKQSDTKDSFEYIAKLMGFGSAMEMVLNQMGYNDLKNVQVIVEGTLMAASQTMAVNKAANTRANKLTPTPFHYVAPRTVVDSITAETETDTATQYK